MSSHTRATLASVRLTLLRSLVFPDISSVGTQTPTTCLLVPALVEDSNPRTPTVWLRARAAHPAHVSAAQILKEDADSPVARKVAARKTPSVRLNFILSFDYLSWFGFFPLFWHIKRRM